MLTRLFLTCALGVWITIGAQGQMTFTEYFLESMERAQNYTIELVEVMPEDKFNFKPVDEVNTFREQVTHVIKNIGLLQTYITDNRDSPIRDMNLKNMSKAQLLANLKITFDHIHTITKDLTEAELEETVDFFKADVRMDKRSILLLMKNHMTLHQGQLIVYLRLNGMTPPRFNGY